MTPQSYKVAIQVIKAYLIDVEARTVEEAINKAYALQSTEIEREGSLKSVTTECVEVVG